MFRVLMCVCLIVGFSAVAGSAATITVRQDGTGDHATLTGAYAAATDGDILEIGPGIYTDYLIVSKSLTFESTGGAAATILDGMDAGRPIEVTGAHNVTFRGLTFRNAYADNGSALFVWHGATVLVDDCSFVDNYAYQSNAVHVRHGGSSLTITGSEFRGNEAALHSAALSVSMSAVLDVTDCVFAENVASGHGAVNALGATMNISGCLFVRNRAGGTGTLASEGSNGLIANNTFHGNIGTAVFISDETTFHNNIVTDHESGWGLVHYGTGTHDCNIYFDNESGPVYGDLSPNELEVDPQFCDWTQDDFTLCLGSPAAGIVNGCGLIGAYGMSCSTCGPVPEESHSWGDLKAMYR